LIGQMADQDDGRAINAHHSRDDLARAILDALRAAGKNPHALEPDDLAPVDEFHLAGKEATLELARLADLRPGKRILDVGGGLGGPARPLARGFRCTETFVDLTAEYRRVGALLTARSGLSSDVPLRPQAVLVLVVVR
jgi:2-polyprenyl-3-methyl-5-hydroxy-6-metoxy-1,4-benzoquinol methylase